MKIKYNHVKLSKMCLALIYFLLDMINSPNRSNATMYTRNITSAHMSQWKWSSLHLYCWLAFFSFFFFFFFQLTIYLFSLYADRLQILHTHYFQFLLALSIAPIREIENHVFAGKKLCRNQVACRDVDKPLSWLVCSISFSFRMGSCNFKSGVQVPTHWSSRFV